VSWVDVLVVLLAIVAGISGWRHGLAVAFLSFVGVLGGAILGVQLAPLLAANLEAKNTQVIVSVVVVVVLVALGETTGVYFGRHIRDRLTGERTLTVDSALGSVLQAITVVLAAWLVALPLATANVPGLTSEVRASQVLRAVDSVMPAPARQLPADLRQVLDSSGFPDVLSPFAPTPITQVGPPNPALAAGAVVEKVQDSILKIRGKAPSCSRQLEGSGFVIGPELVLTNAHVVAGTSETSVEVINSKGRTRDMQAAVISYDPAVDLAVLYVRGLQAPALDFAPDPAAVGDDAVVIGYPRPLHPHRSEGPGPDPAARAEHLRQRRGDARGLHRAGRGAVGQLRRPHDRHGRQGARRGVRRGAGRLGDRLRADRRAGGADAAAGPDPDPPGRHGPVRGLSREPAVAEGKPLVHTPAPPVHTRGRPCTVPTMCTSTPRCARAPGTAPAAHPAPPVHT
jgi:S1-C subfamily serine protease